MDMPAPYSSRAKQHEPDQTWPAEVKVQLKWMVDGRPCVRTLIINGDHFFGRGGYGAPMEGIALVGMIENLRRQGPPDRPVPRQYHGGAAKRKKRGR